MKNLNYTQKNESFKIFIAVVLTAFAFILVVWMPVYQHQEYLHPEDFSSFRDAWILDKEGDAHYLGRDAVEIIKNSGRVVTGIKYWVSYSIFDFLTGNPGYYIINYDCIDSTNDDRVKRVTHQNISSRDISQNIEYYGKE